MIALCGPSSGGSSGCAGEGLYHRRAHLVRKAPSAPQLPGMAWYRKYPLTTDASQCPCAEWVMHAAPEFCLDS